MVDSISRLELNGAPAPLEGSHPHDVLDQLQGILSAYRSSNNALVEQIKDRLAGKKNSAGSPQQERGGDNYRETVSIKLQTDQTATSLLNTQSGQNDHHAMELSSTHVPHSGNNNFQTTYRQQPMSIDWASIAEETQMNYGGDIEQSDQSAAFDRFLMGDSVRLVVVL